MPLKVTRKQARALQLRLDGGADNVTPKRRRDNEELKHQTLLFDRRKELMGKYPALKWMFGTLNGIFIPPALKKQISQSGLVPGVLDVFVVVSRVDPDGTHYCGLAMDLKKLKDGRPSKEQKEWAQHLAEQGWRVYFPEGVVDAWRCIANYLGISGEDHEAAALLKQEDFIRLLSNPLA